MFKKRSQGYSRQMNEFGIGRTTLRIAGLCAVVAGAILAVLINATEPFRVPLGIALGVLAITLLIAYAVTSSSRAHELKPAPTKRIWERQVMFGKITGKKSLAAELALLAELHRSGALSDEEFSAAKRRILGSR
jgi:hypothetical protein